DLADRLGGEFWRGRRYEDIRAAALQRQDLWIDGRIGGLIGLGSHDQLVRLIAQSFAQADEIVLAEVIVLIKHRDLGIRLGFENVMSVDTGLNAIARLPARRPRMVLGVVPLVSAGGNKQLRHLVVV